MQPHIDRGQQSNVFYGGGQGSDVHLTPPDDILRTIFSRPANDPVRPTMTEVSREELNAKLETIEVRMDGRIAAIQASIDGFMGRMEERSLRMDERFQRTDERFARIEEGQRETQASLGSLKTTIITTAVATVIAIVLGVAAFNATVLSNMVASFESGKNTASSQAEVKKQAEETAALLKQVQQQLQDSRKGPPAEPQK